MGWMMKFRVVLCLLGIGLFAERAYAETPAATETDPAKILAAAFNRNDGNRMSEQLKMTIVDARGRERIRVFRRQMLKSKGGDKTLILFESPGDLRNTGLLSMNYRKETKPPDQWLYLPGLGRSTRISSKRRSGSFVGSDLSYADLTLPNPKNYVSGFAGSNEKIDGQDVWHIRVTPKSAEEREQTGYLQLELWISQRSLLPLRVKGSMGKKRFKYIAMSGVRQIDGVWTASKIVARTVQNGKLKSQTRIDQLQVAYDQGSVRKSGFTVHRLEQGL